MIILNKLEGISHHYRKKPGWMKEFGETGSLYIHIPKTAGTSIAKCCYGEDPWHYSISQYKYLSRRYFNSLFKFAFVRNPYTRLASIYKYSFKQAAEHPKTSVKFVTKYETFDEFLMNWLTKKNIESHYFFQQQYKYVCDKKGNILVDFIGKFENIETDFAFIKNRLNISQELKHINMSNSNSIVYTSELAEIVYEAYKKDFEIFGYEKNSF